MKTLFRQLVYAALLGTVWACGGQQSGSFTELPAKTLYTLLPAERTGINFENKVEATKEFNVFNYRNFYNGGGVGLGDFNADGLLDVFLTSNMADNKLYLNKGNFQFQDITDEAGVAGKHEWSTGVSIADVNADGLPDIYLCNAGNVKGDNKANELFINRGPDKNGVPRFDEVAQQCGLADEGYSTHAAFFDYDNDGDLDMYLLNNSFTPVGKFDLVKNARLIRDAVGGDKLFRNDTPKGSALPKFTDVSEAAGIYGSEIGFGLGVTVGDINKDGWLDIYVSNDFFERDYIYMNQGDGTFAEMLEKQMGHISLSSMGADMADINNDAWPDIFVTDMLPESDWRLKTVSSYESYNVYQFKLKHDYYHQFMRNMLHLNVPLGKQLKGRNLESSTTADSSLMRFANQQTLKQKFSNENIFSEIGQYAGVSATDWSWGALMYDMDQDGHKDIFVSNGVYKDVTDQDYIKFLSGDEILGRLQRGEKVDIAELMEKTPTVAIPNYAYHANGQLGFANKAKEWGLDRPGFSNGSAYGDLDNDGDLDLVVHNVNMPVWIYRNEANVLLKNHYLKVRLKGQSPNTLGVGAKLLLHRAGGVQYLEQVNARGFQSSVDPAMIFGLGQSPAIDSLVVLWPLRQGQAPRAQTLYKPKADQLLELDEKNAKPITPQHYAALNSPGDVPQLWFDDISKQSKINFRHKENDFVDFNRERLLPQMLSTEGPEMAKADLNGDGLDDFFIGGAKEQGGRLMIQRPDGSFVPCNNEVFDADKDSEDVAALFFDADGDGDQDLYVVSGGNEYSDLSPALTDRLYVNQGKGAGGLPRFAKAAEALPAEYLSGSCVQANDFDSDGDLDLFVGSRVVPWSYGLLPPHLLLRNDTRRGGPPKFTDVAATLAPELASAGMVSDALWADTDGDKTAELVLVGEWMPISIFKNQGGKLVKQNPPALANSQGWWNRIVAEDFDKDGDTDFIVGNVGLNCKFRASEQAPARLYVNDYDKNGALDQLLCYYKEGKSYPVVLRDELVEQMPAMKKKYLRYTEYAGKSIDEVLTSQELSTSKVLEAKHLESVYVENLGQGKFAMKALPAEAQFSPIFAALPGDFDRDGHLDVLLAGNFYGVKPEVGRYDALHGLVLKGNGKGGFTSVPVRQSGFLVTGQARHLLRLRGKGGDKILVSRNNEAIQVFGIK